MPSLLEVTVVGLLDLVSSTYLVAITKREEVAQIFGSPVFAVRDVALIHLSSQETARKSISAVQSKLNDTAGAQTEQSEGSDIEAETASVGDKDAQTAEASALEPSESVVENRPAFTNGKPQDQSQHGWFATRWLSRGGGPTANKRKRKVVANEDLAGAQELETMQIDETKAGNSESERSPSLKMEEDMPAFPPGPGRPTTLESLTPRILRSARLYFRSSGFYFSYDHDLSRSVKKTQWEASLPLWKRFDSLYFWNQHLMKPFIDAGCEAFVLPTMQGFVGQRMFSLAARDASDSDQSMEAAFDTTTQPQAPGTSLQSELKNVDFFLTLISRRSVNRAGLRYLRRGVDEGGNVANNVETEQILSRRPWDSSKKTFSLLQVRGSIPLFFSQSPYNLKPLPVMYGSEATNQSAFKKHFASLAHRYGDLQVASLVDKHGTEASIGQAYQHHVTQLNEDSDVEKKVEFEWFDFHSVCKGMKFENVSILLGSLERSLNSFGWSVCQGNNLTRSQTGVLRTNCMDCLDRTNVVQSAVGGQILQQQLSELGWKLNLRTDPTTHWFNTLWADNGDAISKQYAGTAALKGDFTRNRKRNWTGALSDFSLTLTRYYNNVFGDYFLQTEIDFLLGIAGPTVFDDFEADLMTKDYALDMQRIRRNAIESCIKIVLEDPQEKLSSGWTLSCPRKANTLRSLPFEECVALLTDAALYFCRFDWTTEKVGSFERIDLLDITEIWRGTYITSTMNRTHLDETKNVGFAFRYKTDGRHVVRTNTRSLQNEEQVEDENAGKSPLDKQKRPEKDNSRFLSFKVLPPKSAAAKSELKDMDKMGEIEWAKHICDELRGKVAAAMERDGGKDASNHGEIPKIEEKDIISAAEAKSHTGYVESLGNSLKRLVWS